MAARLAIGIVEAAEGAAVGAAAAGGLGAALGGGLSATLGAGVGTALGAAAGAGLSDGSGLGAGALASADGVSGIACPTRCGDFSWLAGAAASGVSTGAGTLIS
jgi:hypothetical protein